MIKSENINAVEYYEVVEAKNMLEDEKNRLFEIMEVLNSEVEHLRNKNRSQGNFIEVAKQLYKKQKTNLAFQLSSY